jgi:hypothetical protein
MSRYPAPAPVNDFVLLFLPPCGPHLIPSGHQVHQAEPTCLSTPWRPREAKTFRARSSPAPTQIKPQPAPTQINLQPAPTILGQESVHTMLSHQGATIHRSSALRSSREMGGGAYKSKILISQHNYTTFINKYMIFKTGWWFKNKLIC